MNCCDLMLNEFSCRFCLGEAENGIVITGKTHFRCEKRIIPSEQIFNLLNLRVISSPLVPNRICGECQNTIVAFYTLKKNFHDNEAVLLGKVDGDSNQSGQESLEDACTAQPPDEGNILPIVKEFLKENSKKCFIISKYTGKLTIDCQE